MQWRADALSALGEALRGYDASDNASSQDSVVVSAPPVPITQTQSDPPATDNSINSQLSAQPDSPPPAVFPLIAASAPPHLLAGLGDAKADLGNTPILDDVDETLEEPSSLPEGERFHAMAATARDEMYDALANDLVHEVTQHNQYADLAVLALAQAQDDSDGDGNFATWGSEVALVSDVTEADLDTAEAMSYLQDHNPVLEDLLEEQVGRELAAHHVEAWPQSPRHHYRVTVLERLGEYTEDDLLLDESGDNLSVRAVSDASSAGTGGDGSSGGGTGGEGTSVESTPLLGSAAGSVAAVEEIEIGHDEHRVGIFKAIFNLLNDVIGASIVSVPFYLTSAGLGIGLGMMFVFAGIAFGTLMLLHNMILKRGFLTFSEMCFVAFGQWGVVLSSTLIFIFNFGGFAGALALLGSLVHDLLKQTFAWSNEDFQEQWWSDPRFIIPVAVVLLAPLAFFKTLDRFANISLFCLIAAGILIATVVYTTASTSTSVEPVLRGFPYFDAVAALQSFGGIGYLFTCHDLSFHVVHTLRRPTSLRFALVSGGTIVITLLAFLGISAAAQISYGRRTEDDVMQNIRERSGSGSVILNICRLAMLLNVAISIPYCTYMPRVALLSFIQLAYPSAVLHIPSREAHMSVSQQRTLARLREVVHVSATTLVLGLAAAVACSNLPLASFFGLSGGMAGLGISVILPVSAWMKLREASNTAKAVTLAESAPAWTVASLLVEAKEDPDWFYDTDDAGNGRPFDLQTPATNGQTHFVHRRKDLWQSRARGALGWTAIVFGVSASLAVVYSYV